MPEMMGKNCKSWWPEGIYYKQWLLQEKVTNYGPNKIKNSNMSCLKIATAQTRGF